jgi:hypothetical protein
MKNSTLVVLLLLGFITLRASTNNIVLKNFQAIQVAAGAKVIWEFASEERDVTCHLEKSNDGVTFTPLTTILITSTRHQALHTFTDKEATSQSFYRLRVTKDSYIPYISPIVSITLERGNPLDPQQGMVPGQHMSVFGELTTYSGYMSVKLLDLNGQARIKKYIKGTDLEHEFRTSLVNIPAGYYVLRISDLQNKSLVNRFIYKY